MNGFRLTLGVFRLNACMRAFCLNPCWPRFENVFFFSLSTRRRRCGDLDTALLEQEIK
jgi:hypothetical protein